MVALGAALTVAGCASAPAQVDPPLDSDPPLDATPQATKANPDLDRGESFVKQGKFEEALPHLKAALEADPKSAPAAFYLGLATEQTKGDRAEVERLYKQALALDPKLSEASQNLAAMYLDAPARPDEAIAVLEKALSSAPDDAPLLANLGFAYGLKGDPDKAASAYERSLKKEDAVQTRLAYGMMLFEAKRAEAAVPQLLKAAAGLNDDAASLATIARMLGPGKAFDDCVRLLDRAITLKPGVAELLVRRGICKHELAKEKDATTDYEAALKADPKFQAAHYYLGMSLIAQGNKQKGRAELKKAVELGKDTPIGKQAQEKLSGK
jgi:tetratricopeptide (TPR) repeat protein